MNLGIVTIAYNEANMIEGCIKTVAPYVDEHLVIVSERPYFNADKFESDNTAELAEEYGATVIEGFWANEHEQRNVGAKYFADKDWILWVDGDMWGCNSYWEKLLEVLPKIDRDDFGVETVVTPQWTLWKQPTWHLDGDEFKPVIATKPHVRFSEIGCVNTPMYIHKDRIHHFVWSAPKDIYKKIMTFAHAKDMDFEKWYEDNFKNWKFGDRVVHPAHTYDLNIVEIDIPEEFKPYL